MLTAYWRGKSTNITHSTVQKGALLFDIGTLLIIEVTSQHEVTKGKFVSSIYEWSAHEQPTSPEELASHAGVFYAVPFKNIFRTSIITFLTGNSEIGIDPVRRLTWILMHHLNQHQKLFQLLILWILVSDRNRCTQIQRDSFSCRSQKFKQNFIGFHHTDCTSTV